MGGSAVGDADRSTIEIKILLKNLDPNKSSSIKHKDRLRRLNKFRNYVTTVPPPEFYDDDYSLLLLGSESPTALDDEELEMSSSPLVGLVRAAGTPSTDHKDALKRSARPTIALLRYLCLEFGSSAGNARGGGATAAAALDNLLLHNGELNGFAAAFCALNVPQLRTIRFDVHIGKGGGSGKDGGGNDISNSILLSNTLQQRGGSKEDACHLLALLLVRHTDTDYETFKPLNIMDFLPDAMSRYEFEVWLTENVSSEVRNVIQENISAATMTQGGGGRKTNHGERATTVVTATSSSAAARANPFDDADGVDDDGILGVFGRNVHPNQITGQEAQLGGMGGGFNPFGVGDILSGSFTKDGKPTRWAATHMASEKERTSGALFLEEERENAIAERKKAEEEKKRLLGRDPLGIQSSEQFDLQEIENNRESLILQALNEIEAEIDHELSSASKSDVETVNWLEAQRQSLLALVEAKKKSAASSAVDGESKETHSFPSVLPSSPDFDPMLFLTLVHRNATYQDLQESTSRVSRKTDNQVERLQNLVRDNFALFIKCSEGIDIFADQNDLSDGASGDNQGMKQLQSRFKALDHLAQSASDQARNSFKPLLDNTDEVRKVQSALSVLQRVAPLLQVPSLMRQHIENGNFSSVVKAYRKVLVIDKHECEIDLLRHIRLKAGEAAQDARHDLELILADETSPANSLLDAIRDMGELLELLEDEGEDGKDGLQNKGEATPRSSGQVNNATKIGTFTIDRYVICVRDHTPALACLLLQATHFRSLVDKSIANTEAIVERLFGGDNTDHASNISGGSGRSSSGNSNDGTQLRSRDKRWKFEVLEARVDATLRVVTLAKYWLPRLLQIGHATREAEKRRMARQRGNKKSEGGGIGSKIMSAGDVFKSVVDPALTRVVEHAAYCALGCANQGSKHKISATFGRDSTESLGAILNSPLPATQTAKCAADLAELAEAINDSNESMLQITFTASDGEGMGVSSHSPLERCHQLTNAAVVMIEQRVCIYSFDSCARKCSISASGNGVFDGDALAHCVQKLSDDLTRSDACFNEIEKGCLLVCQKCCEGLRSYVKDRSDAARLRVVAECADALSKSNIDVVREVSYLTNGQTENLESNLSSVITLLEKDMFDVFLENVRRNAISCARLGPLEVPSDSSQRPNKAEDLGPFPPYLASSFLAIVRCRAQVERALRDFSRSDGVTYQVLALQTASNAVVESICLELKSKWNQVRPGNLHAYSVHLQFLISTLKKYLSDETVTLASDTRRMLSTSSGVGIAGKGMSNGPEGLTAIENLERLGRVYVMCLCD